LKKEQKMERNAVQHAFVVVYTAICEATELATGKPIEALSSHLIRGMLAELNLPPEARELLGTLARDADPVRENA
jgi:hypothetical protein